MPRAYAVEDLLPPSQQGPVMLMLMAVFLCYGRNRTEVDKHLSTDKDVDFSIPSVVGKHLLNTNSEIGIGNAAACNIVSI
jgi:hypothetical protein